MRPALAAVRQRVLRAAASPPAAVAGLGLLTGALVMQKVLISAAAAAVLAAGFWAMGVGTNPPAELATAATTTPVVQAAAFPANEPAASPANQRSLLAGTVEPAAGTPAASASAVLVRALVVDGNGDPVPDAAVSVFEPMVKKDKRGEASIASGRQPGPPSLQRATDLNGRVEFTIDHECFVEARKEDIGISGEHRVFPSMRELAEEWRLVLRSAQHIRGVVLLQDGLPAAGATVSFHHTSSLYRGIATDRVPVVTDERGTFVLEVLPDLDYRLVASLGKQYAHAYLETRRGQPEYEVTMRFPGRFSLQGTLYGADGKPTAGKVLLLSAPDPSGTDTQRDWTEADPQGRFEKLLTTGGRFRVVGGVEGQTATDVEVVLDEAHPHQQIELHLTPFVVLAGKVVDERGQPCADVLVGCNPAERTWLEQSKASLQGIYARGPSAADGTFRFLVPAGLRYRLVYRTAPNLYARGPEVTPPIEDAVLVARDSDRQGFEIHGRVVRAADGATVPVFRVYLVTHEKGGMGMGNQPIADGKDGTFTVGPLMVDCRYSVCVEAEGLARVNIGPFDATVRREDVTVRLPAFGSVLCTVLRGDGRPAVQAHVGLVDESDCDPFGPWHGGETDKDGRLTLPNVPPAEFVVYASAAVASGTPAKGKVTVRPGQQCEVQITLRE
jgi:hypothetical protein